VSDATLLLPLVAGNWKMNTTVEEGVRLVEAVADGTENVPVVDVAVLPPFTHLRPVYQALGDSHLLLGAQDVFWEDAGAFTGEISPLMLAGWCDLVLVGHSERRHVLGESDDEVGRKFRRALLHDLGVILAVGETQEERDADATLTVIQRQLDAVLAPMSTPPRAAQYVIAYEPVWAIGTGRTATPAQAQEVCAGIKAHVVESGGDGEVRVLYGGSVTVENAASLFAMVDIDGALVGGASLNADQFCAIVAAAAGTRSSGSRAAG
jgi:triosephosphate isomerase